MTDTTMVDCIQCAQAVATEVATAAEALQQLSDVLADQAQELQSLLAQADQKKDVPKAAGARLDVPWLSQLGPDAGYARGDCGPACVAMWLAYLGHQVAVDDASRATGLPAGFRFTTFGHLKRTAARWGLLLTWESQRTLGDLYAQLDAGRPAITLVYYPGLPEAVRYDASYPYSHWILVVGYRPGMVEYHDPYYPPGDGEPGAFVEVAEADFWAAWSNNHKAGNRYSNRAMIRAES